MTNVGALLADECPLRYSRFFCTHWNGKDKTGGIVDAIDSAEYSGSLISLFDEGMAFVKRNMRTMWKKTPNSRIEMPDYCERSVFEALVNALIHRDYLILGSEVHIDIFDDRMTIYSPGGMPDGTQIQNLDINDIPSTRRNPILADVFNRLGYMERQGFIVDNLGKKTKYWLDSFIKAIPKNTTKKYVQVLSSVTKAVSSKISLPQDHLNFSEALVNEDALSINKLREISSSFIERNDFDSIVDGIGVKSGLVVDDDFLVETQILSKKVREVISKISISKGVNIVLSEPSLKISSIDVQDTEFGLRAIVDINRKGE